MKQSTILPVTSPDVHQFEKFFHEQTEWHICNEVAHHNLHACYATLSFIINLNTYFRLLQFFWHSYFTRYCSDIRFGGIFKYEFVANLPLSLPVKELWKSVIIWGSCGQEFSVLFFIDSRCSFKSQLFGNINEKTLLVFFFGGTVLYVNPFRRIWG